VAKKAKIFIVIPAFNEALSIGKVIDGLKKEGCKDIIVIDDGSKDNTYEIAKSKGVIALRHVINRGLGAGLNTGLSAALKENADIAVTFDADGQHDPKDIKKVIAPILEGRADFTIGSRLINPKGMPLHRRMGNWGFNFITYLLFGVWTTDSQSGLRALNRKALQKVKITANRMEVSSEFFREIKRNKLRFEEVPIKAIYSDYSLSHGQSSLNGFKIFFKLILRKLMR
jgi:glycosyltransferase involved in cell wall biosynthesis